MLCVTLLEASIGASKGKAMDTRRARSSLALIALVGVVLEGFGCTSEADKGVPVEKTKRATLEETKEITDAEVTTPGAAKKAGERTNPMASGFHNPAQACAFILSTKEFRATPDPDVLAECREDYGVTPENAAEKLPKEAAKDQKDG